MSSYAYEANQYPDSDYAVQMQSVCRAKHAEFPKAVNKLDAKVRKWFVGKILNPDGCHGLAPPEADWICFSGQVRAEQVLRIRSHWSLP